MKIYSIGSFLAIAIGATALSASSGTVKPPASPNVVVAGVEWEGSLDRALERSRKENKPVLHLQMFGRLDDALC